MAADPSADQSTSRTVYTILPLVGCLIIAAAVRLFGIRWGLPDPHHLFSYHPDEYHSLRGALSLALGDPNPHFFNYGSLYLYPVEFVCLWHDMLFGADLIGALAEGHAPHVQMAAWTLDARLIVVVCAIVTVYVVWLIGRKVIGDRGATFGALILAVMPLHVLHSHYATVDVPQAMFMALCLYFSTKMVDDGRWASALWAGAAAGFAASVKYNGIIVLIAPMVALATRCWQGSEGEEFSETPGRSCMWRSALQACGATAVAAAAFAITSPFVLLSWQEAWQDIAFEIQHMQVGEAPIKHVYSHGWLFHLHISLLFAPLAVMLLKKAGRLRILPTVFFTIIWFVIISSAAVRYDRYEIALEVTAAVMAGAAFATAWRRRNITRRNVAVMAFCAGASIAIIVLMQLADISLGWLWLLPVGWTGAWIATARHRFAAGPFIAGTILLFSCLYMGGVCYNRGHIMKNDDIRGEMLQQIKAHVPPDKTIGTVWEPWFNIPPIDYCNGGAVLRDNPVFRRFKRPMRPLAICGVDAQCVREKRPYAVVTSNFELNPSFAAVSRRHRRLLRLLDESGRYHDPIIVDAEFLHSLPAPFASVGPDSRYPAPRIRLYLRRDAPVPTQTGH